MTMTTDGAADGGAEAAVNPFDDDAGLVDRRVELAVTTTILAFAVFIFLASGGLRQGSIPDPIGPGGWPRLLAGVLAVTAGVLIFRRLSGWRQASGNLVPGDGGKDDAPNIPSSNIRPYVLLAAGGVWMALLYQAGFMTATFAASVCAVGAMRVRGWVKLVLVPAIFAAGTWLLFGQVFGIRFPNGPLEKVLIEIIPHLR